MCHPCPCRKHLQYPTRLAMSPLLRPTVLVDCPGQKRSNRCCLAGCGRQWTNGGGWMGWGSRRLSGWFGAGKTVHAPQELRVPYCGVRLVAVAIFDGRFAAGGAEIELVVFRVVLNGEAGARVVSMSQPRIVFLVDQASTPLSNFLVEMGFLLMWVVIGR
jgi:hypothetical protein